MVLADFSDHLRERRIVELRGSLLRGSLDSSERCRSNFCRSAWMVGLRLRRRCWPRIHLRLRQRHESDALKLPPRAPASEGRYHEIVGIPIQSSFCLLGASGWTNYAYALFLRCAVAANFSALESQPEPHDYCRLEQRPEPLIVARNACVSMV
jgi:hypothetical protein